MSSAVPTDLISPVHDPVKSSDDAPEEGVALCLSGGGYRAMVFHVGVLWRLNEVGQLAKLKRISTVSGGSITSGVLALHWQHLRWTGDVATNLDDQLVAPVRAMASETVDLKAVITGVFHFGDTVSDRVAHAYRKHLFKNATLQDLPDEPRFVFNATNLESGALMRFSKKYLGDYKVGRIMSPSIDLAVAVAASSAFPPVLSPCTLRLKGQTWKDDDIGNTLTTPGFRDEIRLTDGGVYDNLGLETAWKNYTDILVSDAGRQMAPDDDPPTDPLRQTTRVLSLVDNQVRALRKRQVVGSFTAGVRQGVYIGIGSMLSDFGEAVLTADPDLTRRLADLPTRLSAMDDRTQQRLINWGYTICDAGLRTYYTKALTDLTPTALPYPNEPLS